MVRRGFTLVELLVVIAIVGVLLALLLPAVSAARESGRRTQCLANLRQWALAVEHYHDAHACYPPGRLPCFDPRLRGVNYPCTARYTDRALTVLLLPFLELSPLHEAHNHALASFGPENSTLHAIHPAAFRCPSDAGALAVEVAAFRVPLPLPDPAAPTTFVGRTAYLGNFGTLSALAMPAYGVACVPDPAAVAQLDGVFHDRHPLRNKHIRDGLSRTVFFAERATARLDRDPDPLGQDVRYGWWFVGNVSDTLATSTFPPNAEAPGAEARGFTASSQHGAGAHTAFGDGAAKFLAESIDSWPTDARGPAGASFGGRAWTNVPPKGLWQALWTAAGGEALGDY